jgi:hypothetical protein
MIQSCNIFIIMKGKEENQKKTIMLIEGFTNFFDIV